MKRKIWIFVPYFSFFELNSSALRTNTSLLSPRRFLHRTTGMILPNEIVELAHRFLIYFPKNTIKGISIDPSTWKTRSAIITKKNAKIAGDNSVLFFNKLPRDSATEVLAK